MPSATTTQPRMGLTPATLLRLEGAVLFAGAVLAYANQGGTLLMFVVLFFAPDLSMLGYLVNARVGAALYNLVHTTALPALLLAVALAANLPGLLLVALIGLAHIGMDRFVGYGLKYATAFKDTHLQRL